MKKLWSIFIFVTIFNIPSLAADGWYLHSNWGLNYSMDSVLSVNSDDGDIVHKAAWDGKSLEDSPYYTARVEKWRGDRVSGWEWVHYKMYLDKNWRNFRFLKFRKWCFVHNKFL